jgi:hypothetical protein
LEIGDWFFRFLVSGFWTLDSGLCLHDDGDAVDFGVVFLFGREFDLGGDAELVGDVDAVQPAVECFLGAGDADLHFGAVEVDAGGFRRHGLLVLDGESGGFGLALAELLELGLDVLVGGRLGFALGEPCHFTGHLLAAFADHLGVGEFLTGIGESGGGGEFLALIEIEAEKVEHEETRGGEEEDECFLAGRHGSGQWSDASRVFLVLVTVGR